MESWRKVWREGFAPIIGEVGLRALAEALRSDDPALIQGSTSNPLPLMCNSQLPVNAACVVGLCGWRGEGIETVEDVDHYFAEKCFEADQRLGEPGGCRWLLNWIDDTPREEMRKELLPEVELALSQRVAA